MRLTVWRLSETVELRVSRDLDHRFHGKPITPGRPRRHRRCSRAFLRVRWLPTAQASGGVPNGGSVALLMVRAIVIVPLLQTAAINLFKYPKGSPVVSLGDPVRGHGIAFSPPMIAPVIALGAGGVALGADQRRRRDRSGLSRSRDPAHGQHHGCRVRSTGVGAAGEPGGRHPALVGAGRPRAHRSRSLPVQRDPRREGQPAAPRIGATAREAGFERFNFTPTASGPGLLVIKRITGGGNWSLVSPGVCGNGTQHDGEECDDAPTCQLDPTTPRVSGARA